MAGQRRLEAHERVVAHVEAEHLLLEGEPLRLVELGVGDGDLGAAPAGVGLLLLEDGEEGGDAEVLLSTALERPVDDLLEDEAQALAWVAERVEGASLDQRLHRPLVQDDRVDPRAEVEDVLEGPVGLALGHDALDEALADVAHGGQPEHDGAPALLGGPVRGELGHRAVHVGHEHVDPHGAALGQVHRRLVLVVLDRGQQRRHVLDRVVRLEPRRLVGDEPVAVGVRLVERVVGEGLDDVEELRAELLAVALPATQPATNFSRSAAIIARIFLPHALRRLSASSSE